MDDSWTSSKSKYLLIAFSSFSKTFRSLSLCVWEIILNSPWCDDYKVHDVPGIPENKCICTSVRMSPGPSLGSLMHQCIWDKFNCCQYIDVKILNWILLFWKILIFWRHSYSQNVFLKTWISHFLHINKFAYWPPYTHRCDGKRVQGDLELGWIVHNCIYQIR